MRKSILFLTSAAVSLMLAFSACSGDDKETPPDRPILSSEAGIANIAISHGELTPAFRDDVRNYGASFHTEVSAFSVIVRLKDEKARLTINGNSAGSGQTFPVALSEGRNVINIAVIAEDGKNSNVASVTASVMKLNTKVYVLDGIGGAPVEGAMITLKDASNRLLASNIPLPANKQGTALLGLDPNQKYHIYAKGSNSSEACFAYFDPSKETTAALYCLPGWSAPYVREAPVIERISFADNGGTAATWKDMPSGENQITASHLEIPFVRITAISKNPIIYESGVGTAGPQ
ncbi:MAG: cadherin-like beta sandwich domain-containing protein, partial [Holophagales bacterium]|nr:cadherin-like beta sandwich domain-containing protein [Holophagales bacterium]